MSIVRYGQMVDGLLDRALFAYARMLEPDYLTTGGQVKHKSQRTLDISATEYNLLTEVLADYGPFRTEHEVRELVLQLGLARGVLERPGMTVRSALSLGQVARYYVTENGALVRGVKWGPLLDDIRGWKPPDAPVVKP